MASAETLILNSQQKTHEQVPDDRYSNLNPKPRPEETNSDPVRNPDPNLRPGEKPENLPGHNPDQYPARRSEEVPDVHFDEVPDKKEV